MKIHKVIANILIFSALAINSQAQLQQYKKGLARFEKGDYDIAIKELLKAKNLPEVQKADVNFKIAESYRLTNRWAESAPFYQNAIDAKISNPEANFHYAFALKAEGKYEEALNQLEQFIASKSTNKVYNEKAYREVNTLKSISEILKKKQEISFQNLSQANTKGAEFSPIVRGDEVIFTSSRKDKMYANGLPFVGLYKAKIGAKGLTDLGKTEVFSQNIFDPERNEGTPTFSPDGKIMIFARGNSGKRKDLSPDVDLYISYFDGNNWSLPNYVSASDSLAWDGSPSFSRDGKTIYFSSNRPNGLGGLDLYRVNMDASGRFGSPVNMGKDINTAGDEMFPYVTEDGKLYFASDGHPGLGKLDIFVALRNDGKISVENMGIPYNSISDDFGLTLDKKGDVFFSSNRAGGVGDDDIYYYEVPPKNVIAENTNPLTPEPPKISDADKNLTIKQVNYYLAGTISSKNDDNKISALDSVKIKIIDGENGQLIAELFTNEKGYFGPIKLKEDSDIFVLADKKEYLAKREEFSMAGRIIPQVLLKKAVTDTTFLMEMNLDKIVLNKAFRLDNIYYDLDKAEIRSDAGIELDKLVQVLKDNPTIKIELSSHTDARATDAYNNKLSQKRAESAVNYIISKGIDESRLVAKGYGESQLINKNAKTEEEHQVNRRTEFKVLEVQ